MMHDNCQTAIAYHRAHPNDPSVSPDATVPQCTPSHLAQCNWVGNGPRYACLAQSADMTVPINVYGPLKGASYAKIRAPKSL